MRRYSCLSVLISLAISLFMVRAHANVVDFQRIERIPVAGISLSMGARAAFDALVAAGYNTDVEKYEDWWQPARSFVKGDPSVPSRSPDGRQLNRRVELVSRLQ